MKERPIIFSAPMARVERLQQMTTEHAAHEH